MEKYRDLIVKILVEEYGAKGVYERSDIKTREIEGLVQTKGFLTEPFDTNVEIIENGVKIEVNGQVCTARGSLLVEEEAVRTQKPVIEIQEENDQHLEEEREQT